MPWQRPLRTITWLPARCPSKPAYRPRPRFGGLDKVASRASTIKWRLALLTLATCMIVLFACPARPCGSLSSMLTVGCISAHSRVLA